MHTTCRLTQQSTIMAAPVKPRAPVADKTCVLSCSSLPLSMLVTHTRAGRVQVGGGSEVEHFPAGADGAISKSQSVTDHSAMQDLNGSRFISGGSLPRTCWGPVCTVEHWHSQDNSRLNDVIKCKVTPGDMRKRRAKGSALKQRRHTDGIKRTFFVVVFCKTKMAQALVWSYSRNGSSSWHFFLYPIRNCNCYLLHGGQKTYQPYWGVFKWTDWESGFKPMPAPNHQCQPETTTCSKDHIDCFFSCLASKPPQCISQAYFYLFLLLSFAATLCGRKYPGC